MTIGVSNLLKINTFPLWGLSRHQSFPERRHIVSNKIQRVEVSSEYMKNIHCPFCGTLVHEYVDEESPIEFHDCPHLLFILTDGDDPTEGIAKEFETNMASIEYDGSVDNYTNLCTIPNSIKIAVYEPAPSFFGVYAGFAPTGQDL